MKRLILISFSLLFLSVLSFQVQAQSNEKKLSPKKLEKKANGLFKIGDYYSATDYYIQVFDVKPDKIYIAYQIAESYNLSRDYENAVDWYKRVIDMDPEVYPLVQYKYALMMKMNGRYDEAKTEFEKFIKDYRKKDAATYKKIVKNQILGCDFAIQALKKPVPAKIDHLGNSVNKAYSDMAPVPVGNNQLVYASLRSDTVLVSTSNDEQVYLVRLYKAKKQGDEWVEEGPFEGPFNSDNAHTSNGAFSPDNTKFYFTRCKDMKQGEVKCAIYVSEKEDDVWQAPVELDKIINDPKYTNTYPAIGLDKKGREVLYFVSDRPGGRGGKDIWYSIYNKKTKAFATPRNARKLNSLLDEVTPYYDQKTQTMYFSSNGHIDIGGLDVFQSKGETSKWTNPRNMGYPINSRVDDMYYSTKDDKTGGFFVSNRPGGIALKSETCCDDIWRYQWFLRFAVEGIVVDEEDSTKQPIEDVAITLYLMNTESGEEVLAGTDTTTAASQKMFFFNIEHEKKYKISAFKEKYFVTRPADVSTVGLDESDTLSAVIYVMKKAKKSYVLKNIYYDFDKVTLRPESKLTIDSTLLVILEENPTLIVEIGSHTDCRGSDDYNMTLSQGRAESVVKYLIKKEISPDRLKAKGYGETQFKTNCECSKCSEAEHQLNRRTEFKIIGELEDAEIKYEEDALEEDEEDQKLDKKKKKK